MEFNSIIKMNIPSVQDFIDFFGITESIEISNLENPENQYINEERIENALNTAYEFIMGYEALCQYPGKVAIRKSIKRLMLDIGRYLLDSLQRREDVTTNYENCIDFLKLCIDNKDGLVNITDEEALELGLNRSKISYRVGRRAFTDDNLSKYRNQDLYYA